MIELPRNRTPDTAEAATTRPRWVTWTACIASAMAFGLGVGHFILNTVAFIAGDIVSTADFVLSVVSISVPSIVFALAALALVQPWGRRIPRWLLLTLVWSAAILLSLLGIAVLVRAVSVGDASVLTVTGPGPWSIVGGPLFGMLAWYYTRQARDIEGQTDD